jgi:hypothetical protein
MTKRFACLSVLLALAGVASASSQSTGAYELVPIYLQAADPAPASAPAASSGPSTEELAKLTQNPVANLIIVPFQNNFNFGIGPNDASQWLLNVQPVIPITLNEEWNLITRTIMPIIWQESPADGVDGACGLGDINPTFFFSPAKPGKLIWGVGPTFTLPTGTDPLLTSGKWSAGPAAVALRMDGALVYGCLVSQQWSFAGWGDENVNATVIQPFINYNLPHGWYLSTVPLITANWAADDYDDVWTVPLGGGIGKIAHVGKLPVNLQLQAFDNVVKPDNGADWQLRFQVQFLFPK